MMTQAFSFELVSPEKLIFSGEALSVLVPGAEGDFEVLANHAPAMSSLRPGVLTVTDSSGKKGYFVDGGFADVNSKGLTVLANEAIAVEDMGAARIAQAIAAAEAAITQAANDHDAFNATQKAAALKSL